MKKLVLGLLSNSTHAKKVTTCIGVTLEITCSGDNSGKTKIVDKILASITPINSSIDALWIKEVNKRKTDIETNSVSLVDGDEVFQKIAKRLNA